MEWPSENADCGEINLSPSISPEANDPLLDTFRFGELAVGEHPRSTLRPRFSSRPQAIKGSFHIGEVAEHFRNFALYKLKSSNAAATGKITAGAFWSLKAKNEYLWGNRPVRKGDVAYWWELGSAPVAAVLNISVDGTPRRPFSVQTDIFFLRLARSSRYIHLPHRSGTAHGRTIIPKSRENERKKPFVT